MSIRKAVWVFALILFAGMTQAAAQQGFTPPPGTPVRPWKSFGIHYTVRHTERSNANKVTLYLTRDGGQTWQKYGVDRDEVSPMRVTVPDDGVYGFITICHPANSRLASTPRAGTRPDKFVIVDRTPPQIEWISPHSNQVLDPTGIHLEWRCSDPHMAARSVVLQYSPDGGATWLPLRSGLPAEGSYDWTPPASIGTEILFRLQASDLAGNRRTKSNRSRIRLDAVAPSANLIKPLASRDLDVELMYDAADNPGGSGLARVELYVLPAGQTQWRRYGADEDGKSPMRFRAPGPGRHGLMLVATDKAGNTSALPDSGTEPPFWLVIDNSPPVVSLPPSFLGQRDEVHVTEVLTITWSATDPNISRNSGVLEYSTDGGRRWRTIADNLPVNHAYQWEVPRDSSKEAYVRVTVGDEMGNRATATSRRFGIDIRPPIVEVDEFVPEEGTPPMRRFPEREQPRTTERPPRPVEREPERRTVPRLDEEPIPGVTMPESVGVREPEHPSEEGMIDRPLEEMAEIEEPAEELPPPKIDETPSVSREPDPLDEGGLPDPGDLLAEHTEPGVERTPEDAGGPPDLHRMTEETETTEERIEDVPGPIITEKEAETRESATVEETEDTFEDIPPPPKIDETTPEAVPAEEIGALVENAKRALVNEDIDEAERLCRQALQTEPKNAMANAVFSSVMSKRGKHDKAIEYARDAIALDPQAPAYVQVLGDAYMAFAKDIDATLADERQQTTPQEARKLRKIMERALGNAAQAFQRLSNQPNMEKIGFFKLGQVSYFRGRRLYAKGESRQREALQTAIERYSRAFAIEPREYREAFQIGICHYRLGDLEQAREYLELAVENSDPQSAPPKEAFFYLALIHENLDRDDDALVYWIKASKLYPKGSRFQLMAEQRARKLQQELKGMR